MSKGVAPASNVMVGRSGTVAPEVHHHGSLAERLSTTLLESTVRPTREEINQFMLQYTAHVPFFMCATQSPAQGPPADTSVVPQSNALAALPHRWAPFWYTGADYALALAACFPDKNQVDLSLLSWSENALPFQRQGNLRVFCDAARRLRLPNAPLSALDPSRLQNDASCSADHLKVQHWLYTLSRQFPPVVGYDSVAVRALHRYAQLGEPFLKRRRNDAREDEICSVARSCVPLPKALLHQCASALAPLSPFSAFLTGAEVASSNDAPSYATAAVTLEGGAGTSSKFARRDPAKPQDGVTRQKPWLNYSKPWLGPSLRTAEAKRAASEAAAARRAKEEQEHDPAYTAFVHQSRNLLEQYTVSREAALRKRDQLRRVKEFVLQALLDGKPVNFVDCAARLREMS